MDSENSDLKPLIRVIIPAFRSGTKLLKSVKAILLSQIDVAMEVVIVDNGQNPFLKDSVVGLPVRILEAYEMQSAAYARTQGTMDFSDGILVFLDDDVVCRPDCIQKLITPIYDGRAEASVGNYSDDVSGLNFAQKFKQLYVHRIYSRRFGYIENEYWTAIGAIRADIFHEMGGFDTNFKGACGEDMDLGIRLTQYGYRIWAEPGASGQHLHDFTISKVIRNDFRKGMIAMYNTSMQNVPLSEHRHSSYRDMLSVFFAVCTTCCFLTLPFLFFKILFPCIACISAWLFFRRDVLKVHLHSEGIVFGMRAAVFMCLLDDLRAYCLILGIWKFKIRKKRTGQLAKSTDFEISLTTEQVQ